MGKILSVVQFLKGKKTYAVSIVAIIYALYGWKTGSITTDVAITTILGALGLGGMRSGLNTQVNKVISAVKDPAGTPEPPK